MLNWRDFKNKHRGLTSASLDDINLRTTCLRYSKLISLESLRSEVLVTVVLEVGGLGVDAGGGSGLTLSCFSTRLSGNFSFPSASGSGLSFCRTQRRKHNIHLNLSILYLFPLDSHTERCFLHVVPIQGEAEMMELFMPMSHVQFLGCISVAISSAGIAGPNKNWLCSWSHHHKKTHQ